ncbi:MAG TPA: hypothetical protein PK264_16965 [Hyphomicrobiaceae bacterium]|nr:hypothetical protein [Hyphomicrobiaceae bacterium]
MSYQAAIMARIAAIDPKTLPVSAKMAWASHVARTVRQPADQRLGLGDVRMLEAWPRERLAKLEAALDDIDRIVDRDRNERWNDDVRVKVARTYL